MLGAAALCLGEAGCRRRSSCLDVSAEQRPEAAAALCRISFERTGDPRAAVAVAVALTALKDDAAVVAWARRVGVKDGVAKVWRRAAQAHDRRGELEAMAEAATHAMQLSERAKAMGEASYDAYLAKEAYLGLGKLTLALHFVRLERAFALASTDEDMRATSFSDLFALLHDVGDFAGAKAVLRDMQRRVPPDDALGQRRLRLCEGLLHFHEGNLELARLAYLDALRLAEQTPDTADTRGDYYNLVEIEVLQGNAEQAERHLARALASIPDKELPYMIAARSFFTALVARARGKPEAGAAALRVALAAEPPKDWTWQLEDLLGKVLSDQGRHEDALAAYRRAIGMIEELRRDLVGDVLQASLRDRKRAPYEGAFELAARRGDASLAMSFAQMMWRRGFVESFAAHEAPAGDAEAGAAEAGDAAAGTAKADAGAERAGHERTPGAAPGTPNDVSGSEAPELDAAESRLRGLTALLPRLEAQAAEALPAALAERADGAEVIAFIQAGGALWRYTVGPVGPEVRRLELSAPAAARMVAALRARPQDAALGARLAAELLPKDIAKASPRPLAIVTDGALAGLPFAALLVRGRALVQERTVMYWPTLQVMALPTAPTSPASPAAPAAATSPTAPTSPTASAPPAAVLAATAGRGDGVDLAAARGEVAAIGARLGVEPLVGGAATIAALRASADAPLLHLAAHGGLAEGGAYVRLADGDVTSTDIVTWRLAPKVVVLASCASGARPIGSIWGALGGAFLAAGSRAVVATLWSVEDEATAALMRDFYAAGGAQDPAAALAVAQRRAIAAGVPARQWAAFVVLTAAR